MLSLSAFCILSFITSGGRGRFKSYFDRWEVATQGRKKNLARDTHGFRVKVRPGTQCSARGLLGLVGENRDRWKGLCHPTRAVLPGLPLANHSNLLQLFQMVAVSQTRCQVGEALCAYTAGGQPVGDQRVAGQAEPMPEDVQN